MECVSWRVVVSGPVPELDLTATAAAQTGTLPARRGERPAYFPVSGGFVPTPVLDRAALRPGDTVAGPALIEERESTLVLPPGARATCDAALNLVVDLT